MDSSTVRFEAPASGRWPASRPLLRGPLVFVVNPQASDAQGLAATRALLQQDGRAHEFVEDQQSLAAASSHAVQRAVASGGAVVAVGGDGTVHTVAAAAWRAGLPFGVLPMGRRNQFAREHDLPSAPDAAVRRWLQGEVRPVQLGLANGTPFFVDARLGLHPVQLRQRSLLCRRLALRQARRRYLLQLDGERQQRVSPLLYISNSRRQLQHLGQSGPARGELVLLTHERPQALTGQRFRLLRAWPRPLGLGRLLRADLALQLRCDGELMPHSSQLQIEVAERPLGLVGAAESPV